MINYNNVITMTKCPFCKKEIKKLVATRITHENGKIDEKGFYLADRKNPGFEEYTISCPICKEIVFQGSVNVIAEAKNFMTTGKYNNKMIGITYD